MAEASAGLVCTKLVKSYAAVTVLKGVDFVLPPGKVIGLIGENGAGKSTLSSLITGVRRPPSRPPPARRSPRAWC